MNRQIQEELENFSINILWLRKRHGLTQKQMAQLLRIGIQSLRRIERGEIPPCPRCDIVEEIQRHFSISPADPFRRKLEE